MFKLERRLQSLVSSYPVIPLIFYIIKIITNFSSASSSSLKSQSRSCPSRSDDAFACNKTCIVRRKECNHASDLIRFSQPAHWDSAQGCFSRCLRLEKLQNVFWLIANDRKCDNLILSTHGGCESCFNNSGRHAVHSDVVLNALERRCFGQSKQSGFANRVSSEDVCRRVTAN